MQLHHYFQNKLFMFLAAVCPLFLRPHHSLLFTSVYHWYLYWPPDPRRHLNLLPGLRELFFSSFLKPGSKCQNYHGWCGEYWLLSFFPPLLLFPHSTLLPHPSRIPTSAAPFCEKYLLIALKGASLEYHPNSFSWFTNPCMIWLSLHIWLTFLSVPQYTKCVSSTWNALLSDL